MNTTLSEISAEMLLTFLYPESGDNWIALCDGSFYRSYNEDSTTVNPRDRTIHLTRDGFLKLLPSGYVSSDNDLRGGSFKKKYEALSLRKRLLHDAFVPFDTVAFRRRLRLYRKVLSVLEEKDRKILQTFYGLDVSMESDPYIRSVSPFLPFMKDHRGDLQFVRRLLSEVFSCPVKMDCDIYSSEDSTVASVPRVRCMLIMDGLDRETYLRKSAEIAPFCEFVKDNLVPYEMECEIAIKSYSDRSGRILDYDTVLN